MAFIEKIKQIATGKTEIERKQSAAATQIIRAKARAAAFREREQQEIRLATAREKVYYDRKVAALNKPRPQVSTGGKLNFFREQPRLQLQPRTAVGYIQAGRKKKKSKKNKYRRAVVNQQSRQQQPQKFDVIGFNLGGNENRII